ncbi:YkgJ family cysteine cluster protein [Solidesulfovibrio sp.]|uniref:YkgJ family cysteine cluster protein n=1 Tax=Solidesulfovibrio sp. TaxID=2910990 RepID=UPI00260AF3D4|nr:YkgJ family cysteine cluster protein [Solidesulfovibrio sp.]
MPRALAFTCRRCGHCCHGEGGIVLSRGDINRLAAHLQMEAGDMLARYACFVSGKYRLATGGDGYCVFYAEGCGIHPGRPDVCRAWPYFRGNIIDADSHAMAAEDCPGINREVPHAEFARQGREYLASRGLSRARGEDVPEALADVAPGPEPAQTEDEEDGPRGFHAP